jgi:hypothetical protein
MESRPCVHLRSPQTVYRFEALPVGRIACIYSLPGTLIASLALEQNVPWCGQVEQKPSLKDVSRSLSSPGFR